MKWNNRRSYECDLFPMLLAWAIRTHEVLSFLGVARCIVLICGRRGLSVFSLEVEDRGSTRVGFVKTIFPHGKNIGINAFQLHPDGGFLIHNQHEIPKMHNA